MNERSEPPDGSLLFSDSQQPQILQDRYRIVQLLSEGAFATTYLAIDRQSENRCVIKALSLRLVDSFKAQELFEREAKILSNLNHPRIPRFIDYFVAGPAENSYAYLVQEYIEGENLAHSLKRGKHYTQAEALRIAIAVADILIYLQQFSPPIIHRDIKPSNLIVGTNNEIYLIDFGAVRDKVILEPLLKEEGPTIIGTYGYMPLEQFEGRAAPASDVYSLGATLVHLLSHKEPWEMEKSAMRIDFEPHVHVSPDFGRLLRKMIEPDAGKRYQTASELKRALLDLTAPHPFRGIRSSSWLVAAGLMCIALIATVLSGILPTPVWNRPAVARYPKFTARAKVDDPTPAAMVMSFGSPHLKHGLTVRSVVFSPSGRLIASGSDDDTVSVWDAQTGEELYRFDFPGDVSAVTFSPDEKQIAASGGADTTTRVWNLSSGEPVFRLQGPLRTSNYSPINYPIAYTPDGKFVLSLGLPSTLQVWNAQTGAPLHELKASNGRIEFFAISPDSKTVFTLNREGLLSMLDISSGQLLRTQQIKTSGFVSAAFSPDLKLVATGNFSSVTIHDTASGERIHAFGRGDSVYAIAFSNDAKRISASSSNSLMIWDLETQSIVAEFPGHYGTVMTVGFSPDGSKIVSGGYDSMIRIWHAKGEAQATATEGHSAPVNHLTFSANGKQLISASDDKTTRHWDLVSGQQVFAQTWEGPVNYVVQFSPERTLVSESIRYHVVDTQTKWEVVEVPLEKGGAAFAHSPSEEKFAAGTQSGIEIRETTTGKVLLRITEVNAQKTNGLAFSPDGSLLVSVKGDTSLAVWDAHTGKLLHRFEDKENRFNTQRYLSFTADGAYLVSGGLYTTVWKVTPDGKLQFATRIRGGQVCTLAPDGRTLATGDPDDGRNVILYKVKTTSGNYSYFERVAFLKGHRGLVRALAFSPGGQLLASGGSDGAVVLWNLQQDWEKQEADFLRPNANRNSSDAPAIYLSFDGSLVGPGIVPTWLADPNVAQFVTGKRNQAILLRTALTFPEAENLLLRDSFTVQFWFQLERTDFKHIYVLDSDLVTFDVREHTPFLFGKFRYAGGHMGVNFSQFFSVPAAKEWRHMAIVHDRFQSKLYVYLDGRLVHNETATNLSHQVGVLTLGDQAFDRAPIWQMIDEFYIFPYARTAEQIAADASEAR